MKKIARAELPKLFAAIAAQQTLYIPAQDGGAQARFTVGQEGVALSGELNTARSAKDLFFPQVENLMGFRVTGKQLELLETRDATAPFVLFGVRACDCQCYDIQEFNNGKTVRRFRCWDSCMYSDFTKMSAGQPRPTQLERFRQRFMHKLVYHPDNHEGTFGCVGCGRCLQKCPIHMNIVKVIKELGGAAK